MILRKILFLSLGVVLTLTSGCGENVLGSGEKEPLKHAVFSDEYYQEVYEENEAVINDPEATQEEKKQAYIEMGMAKTAELGISDLDLMTTLAEISQDGNAENVNFFEEFKVNPDDVSDEDKIKLLDLAKAADAFNGAQDTFTNYFTSSLRSQQTNVVSALSKQHYFTMGIMNLYMVQLLIEENFDIQLNGGSLQIELPDSEKTFFQRFKDVMAPTIVSNGVTYYSRYAVTGFTKAEALTAAQLKKVSLVQEVTNDMDTLYKAAIGEGTKATHDGGGHSDIDGSGTVEADEIYKYIFDGVTYDFENKTGDDLDSTLKSALSKIMDQVRTEG